MFAVVITEKGGAQRREQFDQSEVTIGRVQGNDIILPKGNVSKRHSRIVLKDGRFIVVDLKSTNGTYVNGRKITSPLVVKPGDKIYIGDFILSVEQSGEARPPSSSARELESVTPPPLPRIASSPSSAAARPPPFEEPAPPHVPSSMPPAPPPRAPALAEPAPPPPPPPPAGMAGMTESVGFGRAEECLRLVMTMVAREFDVHTVDPIVLRRPEHIRSAKSSIERAIAHLGSEGALGEPAERETIVAAALREAVGLGPLDILLESDGIHEIVVNGPGLIMVDRGRGLEATEHTFSDASIALTAAQRLLARGGKDLDFSRPIHQAALPSGATVTVVLPPVAVRGPIVEIRRIRKGRTIHDLVARGVLSSEMSDLIRKAVAGKKRIVVLGPSSSGVTTVLGAIAQLCDPRERLITVEDVPDLAIDRHGTIALSAGAIGGRSALGELIRRGSELRGDRLVIDDVAGPELFDALTRLATRDTGDLVGAHGGRLPDCLGTLRLLLQLAMPSGEAAADRLLARSIDLVVEVDRLEEGHRVVAISSVTEAPDGTPRTASLFTYDGGFIAAGGTPSRLEA